MKFTWKMFLYIALFYAIVTVIYWQMAHEVVGITALALSTGLALIIGYYFWFTDRRIGAQPQDRLAHCPRFRYPGYRMPHALTRRSSFFGVTGPLSFPDSGSTL